MFTRPLTAAAFTAPTTTEPRPARLAAGVLAAGALALTLPATAQAQPGVGSAEVYGCVVGAQTPSRIVLENGDEVTDRTLLFSVVDAVDGRTHTDEDVTVKARPAGAGADAWVTVDHADGVPVGSVTAQDIKRALNVDVPASEISIQVDGVEEATARVDHTDLSVTAVDGSDLSCASDLREGQQMAPSVTWAPMVWAQPTDPSLPATGGGEFFVTPHADRIPAVTPAGEEQERTFHWLTTEGLTFATNDELQDGALQLEELDPEDSGYPAGTHGGSAVAGGTWMPSALWYAATGEDEDGVTRTRITVMQPVSAENPQVPADGRPTEAGYWEAFDGYAEAAPAPAPAPADPAPTEDPAPAPSEDPAPAEDTEHTVPDKVQTGDEAGAWLPAGLLGLAAVAVAGVAARRHAAR